MDIKELKEPWGESVEVEHKKLKEKYCHLIDYINSEDFYKLSPNAKKVVTNQKVLIESYINNLSVLLYENIDTIFIQDYSMLGLLFGTLTGGFGAPFGNSSPTAEIKELLDKAPIKE